MQTKYKTCDTKWTEDKYISELTRIYDFFIANKKKVFFKDYYGDPKTVKEIPFNSLRQYYKKHESSIILYDNIVALLQSRLVSYTLDGTFKASGFVQFLMKNWYSDDYKDKTEQKVEVTTKDIKFKFGNVEEEEEENEQED